MKIEEFSMKQSQVGNIDGGQELPRASRTQEFVGLFSKTGFFNFQEKPGFCQTEMGFIRAEPVFKAYKTRI